VKERREEKLKEKLKDYVLTREAYEKYIKFCFMSSTAGSDIDSWRVED